MRGRPYPAMVKMPFKLLRAQQNIIRDIEEKNLKNNSKMYGTMVSVGNYFTVSEIMGRILPVWLSMIMKYLVMPIIYGRLPDLEV